MRVLLAARHDLLMIFGGDSVKILKQKEYLEKQGINVDLVLGRQNIALSPYDIIHVSSLQNLAITPWWISKAKSAKKPVVLSTIWWRSNKTVECLYEQYRQYNPRYSNLMKFSERLLNKSTSVNLFEFLYRFRFYPKEFFSLCHADAIIAESTEELELMINYFKIPNLREKASVIPTGLEEMWFDSSPGADIHKQFLPKDFVLTVGRIDYIKNQNNLIKALVHDKEIPLVFVGEKNGPFSYPAYIKEFDSLSKKRGNVFWFDKMTNQDLKYFYQHAKVYCQPSIYETFGIAIFEATAQGTRLVVSNDVGAKSYLKEKASYCDPLDVNSIRTAIRHSFYENERKFTPAEIKNMCFSWEYVAQHLIKTYERVLSSHSKRKTG